MIFRANFGVLLLIFHHKITGWQEEFYNSKFLFKRLIAFSSREVENGVG